MINFKKTNANPKNKKTTDCVVRALSLATGKDYKVVYKELFDLSLKTGFFINEKRLEDKFLEQNGFIKHKQPKKADGTKYKIVDIDKLEKDKTIIIRCSHHLTVVINNTLLDIWDCRTKTINNYYTEVGVSNE